MTSESCFPLALALLTSCAGTGEISMSVWGEDYIVHEIPAVTATAPGFENGWTLRYTRFLVNVGAVTVETSQGASAGGLTGHRVMDLHTITAPAVLGSIARVAAQRWDRVSYEVVPAGADSTAGNATPGDVQRMQSNGYSVYVEADAIHPVRGTVALRWGFTSATRYESCHDASGQPGLVVPTGGTGDLQVTIHGDHLFYDDLQSPDAKLRLDAIVAADRDADRTVTLEELGAVDLTALPTGQYGTGSAPNIHSLGDFVTALVSTVGHFDGEGHCTERR
ncbi:MAG: hypothetical protein WCJ30_00205 [Deltaproteobacteria bacterium]